MSAFELELAKPNCVVLTTFPRSNSIPTIRMNDLFSRIGLETNEKVKPIHENGALAFTLPRSELAEAIIFTLKTVTSSEPRTFVLQRASSFGFPPTPADAPIVILRFCVKNTKLTTWETELAAAKGISRILVQAIPGDLAFGDTRASRNWLVCHATVENGKDAEDLRKKINSIGTHVESFPSACELCGLDGSALDSVLTEAIHNAETCTTMALWIEANPLEEGQVWARGVDSLIATTKRPPSSLDDRFDTTSRRFDHRFDVLEGAVKSLDAKLQSVLDSRDKVKKEKSKSKDDKPAKAKSIKTKTSAAKLKDESDL